MGSQELDPVAAIYHRSLPFVYGYLLSRCGSATLAEDLAAETFMAAVDAARRPGAPEITVAWLVGVARHKLADHWRLGFEEELRSPPAFAMLYGGGLRLLLSVPGQPGAGRPLPPGRLPAAGGSNRIALQVADLAATVAGLRAAGVPIRADVSQGVAVRQALVEDPSGNLVELYEPTAGYHERDERT